MLQRVTQAPIRLRLPLLIVGALMTSIIAMSVVSYIDFRKRVEANIVKMSESVSERSVESVQKWIDDIVDEVDALANDRSSQQMLERLDRAMSAPDAPTLATLRTNYIDNNPFPRGQREQLKKVSDATLYDFNHSEFHDQFRRITARLSYHDLFLISLEGDVIYSVFKEDDFGTNLLTGRYATSGLADVFRAAIDAPSGGVTFSDFAFYAPSSGAPASFLAEAVLNEEGETIGVVAIQLPIQSLQTNLTASSILGPQDEAYLLGADGLARTGSVEPGYLSILDPAPALPHLMFDATRKEAHFTDVIGLRGINVHAHIVNFDVLGTTWTAVVERNL